MNKFENLYTIILEQNDEKVLKTKDFTITFQAEANKTKKPEQFSMSLVKDMQDKFAFKINYRHYEFYSYITKTKQQEIEKIFNEVIENEDTIIDYFLSDNIVVYLDLIESANFISMLKDRKNDRDIYNKAQEAKKKDGEDSESAKDDTSAKGEEPDVQEQPEEIKDLNQNARTLAKISSETEE